MNQADGYVEYCSYSGAILAMGRSSCETTLWSVQNEFFLHKMVIICIQTNITQLCKRSLVQNTAGKAPWRGFWTLCEHRLRKIVGKTCRCVTLRRFTPTHKLISRMAPAIDITFDQWYWFNNQKKSWIRPFPNSFWVAFSSKTKPFLTAEIWAI